MATAAELIGQTIRRTRRQRGWSVEDLASRAAVRASTLRRIEAGKTYNPHEQTLRQIEAGAELPAGVLVGLRSGDYSVDDLRKVFSDATDTPLRALEAAQFPAAIRQVPLAFGHSMFAAPLIWSLANKRAAARKFCVASYARAKDGLTAGQVKPEWQSIAADSRRPDGNIGGTNLEAPRLDQHAGEERPARGITRKIDLDVLAIDPLFGPRIRDMWLNNEINAAFTMREAFADLCALAPEQQDSAIHCASISHRRRGCELIALINPHTNSKNVVGSYAERYLKAYYGELGAVTQTTGPNRRDLALEFVVKETFEPRWDKEVLSNDYLCLPSLSNAKKQASTVTWFDHPTIRHHDLTFASFGCLWNQIKEIMMPPTGRPADLMYLVLWEPLATWVRHFWAKAAYDPNNARVAAAVMEPAAPRKMQPAKWQATAQSEHLEYAWSVEVPLEALAGLVHRSPVLPSISMNLFFRNSFTRDLARMPGGLKTIHDFISDLSQVLMLYNDPLYHSEFIDQTAAYLSLPRGRCHKGLSEIEFQLDVDLKWLDFVRHFPDLGT